MSKHSRTPLQIRLEGPAVKHNRIALNDLLSLGEHLQAAVQRIGQVLSGQKESGHPGRRPAEIQSSCTLEVISITKGSLCIQCDLPVTEHHDMFDLGEQALECFVNGVKVLESDGEDLPEGYDRGVLTALKEQGKLFDRGIQRISFSLKTKRKQRIASSYTPDVYRRVIARIEQPIEAKRTLEGRLLMADFKETGFRCRIHPTIGPAIPCAFNEGDKGAILSALTHKVRLLGEAQESGGRIREFNIEQIEVLDRDAAFFGPKKDLASLAKQQGVEPITDFDRLASKLWPEDEGVDEFIESIRAAREQDLEGESP